MTAIITQQKPITVTISPAIRIAWNVDFALSTIWPEFWNKLIDQFLAVKRKDKIK